MHWEWWITIKSKYRNKIKKVKWILCILLGSIVYLLYFYHFHNGFSSNSSDWSAFGDYISGISSVVNVILFVYISIMLHQLTKKDSAETKIYESLNNCIELASKTKIYIVDLKNETLIENDICKLVKDSIFDVYTKHNVLNSIINTLCKENLSPFSSQIQNINNLIIDILNMIYQHTADTKSKTDDTWKDDIKDKINSINLSFG
jgi:magnesium-transporting ATPase (P-type)